MRLATVANDRWGRGITAYALRDTTFMYAFAASMVIHGVLVGMRFHVFDINTTKDVGPPLTVALVNAKSQAKPAKAEILAQANLDGGGNTDANRRLKSPLPVLPTDSASNEIALATRKVETLERRTKEMLTEMKGPAVAPPVPAPKDSPAQSDLPSATDLMQKTLEVMRLEAQIAKDMDAYQKRPKRKHVGASAEEYRFARYVEDWRLKVERVGNMNYPEAAREQKLYGNLILTVSIRADGAVEKVIIEHSSGQTVLDAAAKRIVEMAGPYAPFPPDIKRDTDILDITRTWSFKRGDELTSE